MQAAVIFVVIILVLAGFYFVQISKTEEEPTEEEQPLSGKEAAQHRGEPVISHSETYIEPTEPSEEEKQALVNTYITSGPKEGEIIPDTNKVSFGFKEKILAEDVEGKVSFETKIEGFDEDWQKTSAKTRTVNLPAGPKEYTFFVRAKVGEAVDATPAQRTFQINTSYYYKKVRVGTHQTKTSSRPSLIGLNTQLQAGEEINITGWRIKGNKGEILIPQGVEVYYPNSSNPPQDITIERGDKLYFYSSTNPMGAGKHFRPNKCFGFLAESYEFTPKLSFNKTCPKITLDDISYLSGKCQNFILKKMGSCKIPDYSDNLDILFDQACQSYIDNYVAENLNYSGCFENYYADDDFLENRLYFFIGRDIVSQYHDTLYLYDKDGLIVDKLQY
jgi:hypothetical protein